MSSASNTSNSQQDEFKTDGNQLRACTVGQLKREAYDKVCPLHSMKSEKQIRMLKTRLVRKFNPADSAYYGLSLEDLTTNN
ncbi:hypothetical protein K0U27_02560 [archaeon]|nr:hypothetical protein [archaeon]